MTYQVLARKWRPQDFDGLVGQDAIVTALRNAIREGRIAQAYLFSGIRGVGKTTAARLLAKALNCENGPAENPCNECTACREITGGSDLDVLEIDAATYSKVEQVRELTEALRYGPARDRRKVVVLDEVHRLSRQAFDALLKIVEEPPAHLTFIFATTEIEAVPATILSRCQEFHFRRVPAPVLVEHLRTICEAEEIEASDTALRLVARAGEGSVRDSVALLDQLATFGGNSVSEEDAARLLGGLDTALFEQVLVAMLRGDGGSISNRVAEIEDRGYDPRSAFAQFLDYLRDGLHLALGGRDAGDLAERIELPEEERDRLAGLAREAGAENLLRLLHLLVSAEPLVRRVEDPAVAVEVSWLRAAELPKLVALERALGSDPGTTSVAVPSLGEGAAGAAGGADETSAAARTARSTSSPPAPKTASGPPTARGRARSVSSPPADPAASPPSPPSPSSPPATSAAENGGSAADSDDAEQRAEAERHPGVQAVLEVFGGRVEAVEEHDSAASDEPS